MLRTPLVLLAISALLVTGCDDDDDDTSSPGVIPVVATDNGLTTLVTALEAAELDDDLSTPGPFTVFAPTNDAFAALGSTLDDLLLPANQATLVDILTYHVLTTEENAAAVVAADTFPTLQGDDVIIDTVFGTPYVNDATIVTTDVDADNGIVHVIDTVLRPETDILTALSDRGFTELAAAVNTVATAGVDPTLISTLTGSGPITVFAPTDAAFTAIAGVTATLSAAELADILRYHVIDGAAVKASAAVTAGTATTLQGSAITITADTVAETVSISGAGLSSFNIPIDNGIIHVVDAVLLPPAPTLKINN